MATGIAAGIRQLASALGVAIIGSVINNIEHYRLLHSFSLKSSFTFAFSIGMIVACILVIFTFMASFLLPNKPLLTIT